MKKTFVALLIITLFSVARADEALSPKTLKLTAVSVLTSGSPADIGSIAIPNWITRFTLDGGAGGPLSSPAVFMVVETASGSLSGASFVIRDGPNGTGQQMSNPFGAPASTGQGTYATPYFSGSGGVCVISSATTLYVNQVTDSSNAGTVSVFVILLPLD